MKRLHLPKKIDTANRKLRVPKLSCLWAPPLLDLPVEIASLSEDEAKGVLDSDVSGDCCVIGG